MRRLTLTTAGFLFLVLLPLVNGCGNQNIDRVPRVRYGKDLCAECRMIIQDARFASAIAIDGEVVKFDDIGCMSTYLKKHGIQPQHQWVHDFESQQWMEAENGFFVQARSLETPMGYGIAAFLNRQLAEKFLEKEKGTWVSFEALSGIISKNFESSTGEKQ